MHILKKNILGFNTRSASALRWREVTVSVPGLNRVIAKDIILIVSVMSNEYRGCLGPKQAQFITMHR